MKRNVVIGVMGGGAGSVPSGSAAYRLAEAVGRAIGRSGAVLLCGGGSGVMEASAKGAKETGGMTIGILPSHDESRRPFLDEIIPTGLGDARNYINVRASDAVFALPGGAGTLSEIALALKAKKTIAKPVIVASAWRFLIDEGYPLDELDEPDTAVSVALDALGADGNAQLESVNNFPIMPGQEANRRRFAAFLATVAEDRQP